MQALSSLIALVGVVFFIYYYFKFQKKMVDKPKKLAEKMSRKIAELIVGSKVIVKYRNLLDTFDMKMKNRGFTKRIVIWDFLPEKVTYQLLSPVESLLTMGIWVNFKDRLISFRKNRDSWEETDIYFDKIIDVQINEDGFTRTIGASIGGTLRLGAAKSQQISTGIQVRIVSGDQINGTKSEIIDLYKVQVESNANTGKLNNSSPIYKAIMDCTQSIVDEINYMSQNG